MRAAVFRGPNNIANEEVDYNHNDETRGGVSLKVNACSVCGYDARVYRNGHKKVTPPIILGHEICGQIEKDVLVTDDVRTQTIIKAGSRVVVSPIIPCLDCKYCHNKQYNLCISLKEIGSSVDGGFAEFVRIPEKMLKIGGLVSVPNNLSDEEATLLEPLACCLNGFSQIGPFTKEETTVAIIGDGPIGLLHLQISKRLYGAKTIVFGKIPNRIQSAKLMGADAAITLSDNDYYGNDPAYSNKEALKDILDLTEGVGANKNSIINIFAGMPKENNLSLDPNWLHYNQITITGSFSSVPNVLQQAARLASNREIDLSKLISHRYSLVNIKAAILATENYYGLRVVIDDF
jgi:L-iditol 2-dehydrogenase